MLEKGFLRHSDNKQNKHRKIAEKASQALTIMGVLVLAGSFGYLAVKWGKSEALLTIMMPFLASGLGLILVGYLIKRAFSKLN